jgi:CBS domain-containing protein
LRGRRGGARTLDDDVNRLPVVGADRLVGIVTRADIVRAFARPDPDVAVEAREQIALQRAWPATPRRSR